MNIKITKSVLIAFLLQLSVNCLFADGTKDVYQNANSRAYFVLYDANTDLEYYTYEADSIERMYIHIDDVSNEKIHFGFDLLATHPKWGSALATTVYFRLVDPLGNIVMGPTLVPTSAGTGFIASLAEAQAGPNTIDPVNGYNPFTYTPSLPGDYYLEFNPNDPTTVSETWTMFNMFDITVAEYDTDTTAIDGRVWFPTLYLNTAPNAGEGNFDHPFEADCYIYHEDSILTNIDFNGMQGLGFAIYANATGPQSTDDVAEDRKSVAGQVLDPHHMIFLSQPDPAVYPNTNQAPSLTQAPNMTGCNVENYYLNISTSHNGLIDWYMDFNGNGQYDAGTVDLRTLSYASQGLNQFEWDGNDGLGNPVADGTSVDIYVLYQAGLTHLPLYDMETNSNGFIINTIAPAGGVQDVYWNDADIGGVESTATPCIGDGAGCHTWTDAIGESNTVNTWWVTHYDNGDFTFTKVEDCAPNAVNDTVSVDYNTPKTIDVTDNDTEPDGDAITVSIFENGDNGTGVLVGNDIQYTPNNGFVGNDTITYVICDQGASPVLCDTAIVIITVECDDDGIEYSMEGSGDTDGDGVNDNCDLDSDNDGITDADEYATCVSTTVTTPITYTVQLANSWTTTTSHTAGSGSNRVILLALASEQNGGVPDITAVTYGGQSMLPINEAEVVPGFGNRIEWWYIKEQGIVDAGGASNFAITGGNGDMMYHAVTLRNVDQTTSIGANSTNTAENQASIQLSAGLAAADKGVVVVGLGVGAVVTFTPDGSYTEGTDQNISGQHSLGVSYQQITGTPTENPTTTISASSNRLVYAGFVVNPHIENIQTVELDCDADNDGIPNYLDLDSDNDGIPDAIEANNGVAPAGFVAASGRIEGTDTDGDGLLDVVDNDPNTAHGGGSTSTLANGDYDGDGIPNFLDKDSDNDGILDIIEAGGVDADGDGEVDSFSDSNNDGINDATLGSPLPIENTDGSGNADYLDMDSDGDGITDNREGQTTAGFTAMAAFADADGDGIADQYDTDSGNNPITPVDSDGDGMPDYQDTDSDNDSVLDIIEGNDNNQDGVADGSATGTDNDNDGIDDGFDADGGTGYGGYSNYALQDTNGDSEDDFRDKDDDGDGINTLDETADLDGNMIPDYLEVAPCPSRFTAGALVSGNADAVHSQNGVTNPNNVLGVPDGSYADLRAGDWEIVDLTDVVTSGTTITLYLSNARTSGNIATATIEQSADGSSFSNPQGYTTTTYRPVFESVLYSLTSDARYIRVTRNSQRIAWDAVDYSFQQCNPDWDMDGIPDAIDVDDDNDGILDIAEGAGDSDGDGILNQFDLDSDNDGIPDSYEANGGAPPANMNDQGYYPTAYVLANDANNDGMVDGSNPPDYDTDSDGIPDRIDLDSDGDGIVDAIEANDGSMPANMNSNGQYPVAYATANDADGDGLIDDVDLDANGTLLPIPDNDGDGIVDYRDLDSDGDTVPDNEEGFDPDVTASGSDADGDGIDDAFDTDSGGTAANLPDTDGDGRPDYLDVCFISVQNGDWHDVNTWGGIAYPSSCDDCVEINHTVTLTNLAYASDVTIYANGEIILNGNSLKVCGDITNNGNCITGNGTVEMEGSQDQEICGDCTFQHLEVDNPNNVEFCTGSEIKITDLLTLTQGTLNTCDADSVILCSTASVTALVEGTGTGGINCDITVQRYVSGCSGYLTLGAPFDATFADFVGTHYQGFPSTAYPTDWKNVILYDETETTYGVADSGYYNPTDITDNIAGGTGFLNYIWNALLPRTIEVTGAYSMDPFNLPITYSTSAQGNLHDGFNLVANPYPSTIDWGSAAGWSKVNCCDAVYTFNRCGSQYSNYVGGISVNGGTPYISPLAGFWVKAHDPTASIQINRDAIVDEEQDFYSLAERKTLNITMGSAGYEDEIAISYGDTSSAHSDGTWFGAIDIRTNIPGYPSLYSVQQYPWGSYKMAINMYPPTYVDTSNVQLMFKPEFAGTYHASFDGLDQFGDEICITLEDKDLGIFWPVNEDSLYQFEALDTSMTDRFILHFSNGLNSLETEDIICDNVIDGKVVANAINPSQFIWKDHNGDVIQTSAVGVVADSVENMVAGQYALELVASGNTGCEMIKKSFFVNDSSVAGIQIASVMEHVSACDKQDGNVTIFPTGGTAPYDIIWNTGETGFGIDQLTGGNYSVKVTDVNGCVENHAYNIDEFESVNAYFLQSSDTVYVHDGALVEFHNLSFSNADFEWTFGDGNSVILNDDVVNYAYADTGDFEIKMVAVGAECSDTAFSYITVIDTTSTITDTSDVGLLIKDSKTSVKVYPNPNSGEFTVVYRHDEYNDELVQIELIDLTGKTVFNKSVIVDKIAIVDLNVSHLPSGIYFLQSKAGMFLEQKKVSIVK